MNETVLFWFQSKLSMRPTEFCVSSNLLLRNSYSLVCTVNIQQCYHFFVQLLWFVDLPLHRPSFMKPSHDVSLWFSSLTFSWKRSLLCSRCLDRHVFNGCEGDYWKRGIVNHFTASVSCWKKVMTCNIALWLELSNNIILVMQAVFYSLAVRVIRSQWSKSLVFITLFISWNCIFLHRGHTYFRTGPLRLLAVLNKMSILKTWGARWVNILFVSFT